MLRGGRAGARGFAAALVLALSTHASLAASPDAASPDVARLATELSASDAARRARAARELSGLDPEAARPLLRRALEDVDPDVRAAATVSTGQLELAELAPLLLGRAQAGTAQAREVVVEALGRLRPVDEAEARPIELALARALGDAEERVRVAALRGLAQRKLGAASRATIIEAIAGALSDAQPELRRAAADALEWLADPLALDALAARVDDPSPEVRYAVARALAAIGDVRAAPAVARLASDSAEEVRGAAIATLGALGDPSATARLAAILARPRDPLAGAAALALGRIVAAGGVGDDAVAKTLRARAATALVDAAQGEGNRSAALEGLRVSGDAAATLLGRLLPAYGARPADEALLLAAELAADGSAPVTALLLDRAGPGGDGRFDAALTGARPPLGPVRTALVTWLAARLGDPGTAGRRAAAVALGALGDPRAARVLEAALADADAAVRRAALLALTRTTVAPEPLLLATARGDDAELARAALGALARRHDEPARQALLEALGRGDAQAARIAALGLADDAGATSVVPGLRALLKTGGSATRANAVLALLGPLRGRPDPVTRELCLALAATDDDAAPGAVELLGAMHDTSSAERLASLLPRLGRRPLRRARIHAALGELGAGSATMERALVAALADGDAVVRLSAAWALGKLGSRSETVERALVAHLADPSAPVRANALAALARLGRPPAHEILARLARDREPAIVANAVRLGAHLAPGRARPALLARAQAQAQAAVAVGRDYLLVRVTGADRYPTAARIGLPDGLVEVAPVDERGFLRDEGVATGDLIIDVDDALLR